MLEEKMEVLNTLFKGNRRLQNIRIEIRSFIREQ
jgi:hypothetical protein